jgi:hypothetical protein
MSNTIQNTPNVPIDKPNQFPWKLYDMLHTAEKRNEEHIISWINDGRAFKVHNRDLFIEQYMKRMFNQTKFKSFQRQLNLWGFERVQNGPDKGSYFHPLFVRGRRECCQRLTRVRLKGTTEKTSPHGVLDKAESPFSPQSVSSTATAAETISTMGAGTLPVAESAPSAVGADTAAKGAPISLLGAFVDVSQPATTTATGTSFQTDSRRQQFEDLIQYRTSQERREMIRNAAIGLRPDMSIAVVGAPIFATATDTSKDDAGSDQVQHHQEEQKHHEHSRLPTHETEEEQKVGPSFDQSLQQQERIQPQQQPQQSRRRSSLEALLSVTAQRRREEELALLMGLSDHGAMSHTR